ncbi:ATP-binding protein (plasmid) [Halarchaeum sp. CBA1220]|uniref:AAA family ATPase n=1 Tax=Halarchaeum sp. CBA1220 TaxID=1853682 RepID=UPI000F3A8A35|nr:AAA family ATPase [Halarchaeum sp. CBA1220]QLC35569.1 ATP-binding protein [Halarchaeum sp. CBA1220]
MDLNNYKEEILQKQYSELLQQGDEARKNGDRAKAAKAFREAADRRKKLADLRGVDYEEEIEKLERAAKKLDDGESLSTSVSDENSESTGDAGRAGGREEDDTDYQAQVESFISQTDVTWDDIGGLDDVKSELKRTIALGGVTDKPDAVAATDRVLLFGPPGTGKTLLASAVAGSLDATFFDVKLGGLLSKYFGETSKQITALFDLAEEMSPSIVFLDEIDALTQSRDSDLDETSRRVLNTLLSELDGIDKSGDDFVMVLGSTNTPWDLDQAIRRRFPRRVLIPLPDVEAAKEIVAIHTVDGGVTFEGSPEEFRFSDSQGSFEGPVEAIAQECVERGYTGSDVEAVCRAAVNSMVSRTNSDLESIADRGFDAIQEYELAVDAIRPADVRTAFERTSASLSESDVRRFDEWDREFGSGH